MLIQILSIFLLKHYKKIIYKEISDILFLLFLILFYKDNFNIEHSLANKDYIKDNIIFQSLTHNKYRLLNYYHILMYKIFNFFKV